MCICSRHYCTKVIHSTFLRCDVFQGRALKRSIPTKCARVRNHRRKVNGQAGRKSGRREVGQGSGK